MTTATHFLGAGLLAGAFAALTAPLDEPAFRPEVGSTLTKAFEIGANFELDDFSAVVDGQDFGAMLGSFSMSVETTTSISVTDEYAAVEDGRPTRLLRTYDTILADTMMSFSMDFGGEEQELSSSSELEGSTVVFTWNEDEGEYDVAFADEEGDSDLLDGLREEMDLRFFLPPGEVSEDETWEVDVKELIALATPGGDLSLLPDDQDMPDFEDFEFFEDIFGDDLLDQFEDLFEGSCECTYQGSRDEEGVRVAEIAVELEIASAADLSDLLIEILDAITERVGADEIPIDVEIADLNLDLEGQGVLLWDLEAGQLHSFELTSDVVFAIDLGVSVEEDGTSHFAELSVEMSGSVEHLIEAEE